MKTSTAFPTQISENRRFLLDGNGAPFFYLADTAWELLHRLDREETEIYLQDRAAKGFNVIQTVVLAEIDGLRVPNRDGHLPLHDLDPTRPNEAYFQHVDWVISRADELGMCLGLLPTWGDKWNLKWGVGPEIFTPENAAIFGEWLGKRYQNAPLVWILGGDRPVETDGHRKIIEAMALGLSRGDGGHHLRTFHPCGRQSSSEPFPDAPWLDFHMAQSGHRNKGDNSGWVAHDYALSPRKPCLDGEPGYENHPSDFKAENPWMTDADTRRFLYFDLCAGACGHTFGCHSIWQFWQPPHEPRSWAHTPWREALHLPGAAQMQHARRLLEARPFLTRIPAPEMVLQGDARATRDQNGSYALVYFPTGAPATLDLTFFANATIRAHWFDPRDGKSSFLAEFSGQEKREFVPPVSDGKIDWVLILDDAARGFPIAD